jgi:hypothetical protein
MGSVNRTIIAAVIIIMATGVYHFFLTPGTSNKTTLTRIIVGAFMLGLFVSLFDLVGFGVGQVGTWLLMLAVGVALYTVIGDLYTRFSTTGPGQTGAGGSPKLR